MKYFQILIILLSAAGCGDDSSNAMDAMVAEDATVGRDSATDSGPLDGGADADVPDAADGGTSRAEAAWIANRGAGEVTILSDEDLSLSALTVPDGGEPMYLNYSPLGDGVVIVGDRANDRAVVFSAGTREVVTTMPAGAGIFHQWIAGSTYAVNADVDRETHVFSFDGTSGTAAGVIPMPADLAATAVAKPHDVFVSADEASVYVTYIGFDTMSFVVRFARDGADWTEMARAEVGGDSHLYLTGGKLFVPCQESSEVYVLDPVTLTETVVLDVPGAHGITVHGGTVFVGNISDPAASVISTIDVASHMLTGAGVVRPPTTATGGPHNLWTNTDGTRIYLTHSGSEAHWVSTYTVSGDMVTADSEAIDVAGLNPFGLTFVPAG